MKRVTRSTSSLSLLITSTWSAAQYTDQKFTPNWPMTFRPRSILHLLLESCTRYRRQDSALPCKGGIVSGRKHSFKKLPRWDHKTNIVRNHTHVRWSCWLWLNSYVPDITDLAMVPRFFSRSSLVTPAPGSRVVRTFSPDQAWSVQCKD